MRKIIKITVTVLLLATVIAAAEKNVLGYAARSVALAAQGGPRPDITGRTPAAIMAASAQNIPDALTILAVGDLADCPTDTYLSDNFPTLQDWAGLTLPPDPARVGAAQTALLAAQWPTAPILAVGDLAYGRGAPADFANCFAPIWGGLKDRILPAPGNHEYRTPGAYAYYDYWNAQAGPDRRGYYFVKSGAWLLLSLNSEIDSSPGSQQAVWLADILAAAPEPCILGFFHKPAYALQDRDRNENAEMLFSQLQDAGATLVVNGHNHFYERTRPLDAAGQVQEETGTVAFVVGTGGREIGRARPVVDTTAQAIFGKLGILRLALEADSYSWWFHDAVTNDVHDQGTRACNKRRHVGDA